MICSDNILYYSYVAFETYKDLAEHLKQDATKKFIKCAAALPHMSPFPHSPVGLYLRCSSATFVGTPSLSVLLLACLLTTCPCSVCVTATPSPPFLSGA